MNSSTSSKVYNNQYLLKKKISQGSYGIVFEGEDQLNKQQVAIKVEKKEKTSTLDREIHILMRLQGTQGVPKLHWSGNDHNTNVLVLQYLTKDLGAYMKELKKFSLKTVLVIADQLLQIIRRIHNKSVVHRDLKPENLMVHLKQIFIVDFGISKLFRDINLKHIPYKEGRPFVGTTRYASIAAHKGQELGRKDDLESLLYIFVLMLKGSLPWQNMIGSTNKERQRFVGEKKQKMSPQDICSDLPVEFAKALDYVRSLQFQSEPDYEFLIQMFRKLAQTQGITYDDQFDWNLQTQQQNQNSQQAPKQVSSLIQFEKQPLALQNKYQSLQIPSTGDVLGDKKRLSMVTNNSMVSHQSYYNTFQMSCNLINEVDVENQFDHLSNDDSDTLYKRYVTLQEQSLMIRHPSLMRMK